MFLPERSYPWLFSPFQVLRQLGAHTLHTCTRVTFRDFAEDELAAYLATGEPLDKAGAYGIQGHGALLIEGIEGDYYSVMGLPVAPLYTILRDIHAV